MAKPDAAELLRRADEDIARGESWRARARLRTYLSQQSFDPRFALRLGELELAFGDGPDAGRYLWLASSNSPEHQAAIQRFLRRYACASRRRELWNQLPRSLRKGNTALPARVQESFDAIGLSHEKMRASKRRRKRSSAGTGAGSFLAILAFLALLALGCMKAWELLFT